MSEHRLDGDVAIVTGAGRNIGRAIAERFAAEGAQVAVVDIDEDRSESTVESIRDAGGEAMGVRTDISDEGQVERMVEETESRFGPVDILVNNAAINRRGRLETMSVDAFDRVLAVNLRGTFLCTRAAAESMKTSGGGRIVNVSSTSAHKGRTDSIAYATSKSGILNFTRCAAKSLAAFDIRVNTLTPTRTGSHMGEDEPRRGAVDDDILVGRWGRPADQANAALFLVSAESEFVTGTEVFVDGGSFA